MAGRYPNPNAPAAQPMPGNGPPGMPLMTNGPHPHPQVNQPGYRPQPTQPAYQAATPGHAPAGVPAPMPAPVSTSYAQQAHGAPPAGVRLNGASMPNAQRIQAAPGQVNQMPAFPIASQQPRANGSSPASTGAAVPVPAQPGMPGVQPPSSVRPTVPPPQQPHQPLSAQPHTPYAAAGGQPPAPPSMQARPLRPTPPGTQPSRPLPPEARAGTAAITNGLARTSLGGASPPNSHPSMRPIPAESSPYGQYPSAGYPQQGNAMAAHQAPPMVGVQVASVADPNFLPRPKLESAELAARVATGDPVPKSLSADVSQAGIIGGMGMAEKPSATGAEPMACMPEHFVPTTSRSLRLCARRFPSTMALAKKYGMPLGAIIQPMARAGPNEPQTPVVNFGATGIVRCRRCRSYVNAWCRFTDGGRRWQCSMCQYVNDVPSDYFSPLDQNGRRRDAAQRPELHRGSIEFVAPAEYMVRPPMPPVYLFVLEVTPAAISSGALLAMVSGIKVSLNALPDEGRTRVGLITFDAAVHFHILPAGKEADPTIATVADTTDMFLPRPDGILVQLAESRSAFEKSLDMLSANCQSAMQQQQQQNAQRRTALSSHSCLGAALQGAQKVLERSGGKIVVLAASRPTAGPGALRDRGDNAVMGTDRERAVLRPDSTFYRQMAVEYSKFQISCDLFLCPPPPGAYLDVATLAQLAKFTGGEVFRTAAFEAYRDHGRLQHAVYRMLSRETGFEAVMRVRATRGVRCSQFHGRFFVRSTDLLAMPNVDCDKTYAVQFAFDESTLSDGPFCVQVALLYTTTSGERRIRVHTAAVPVTNSIYDLVSQSDAPATSSLFLRLAAESVKDRAIEELKKNLLDKVINGLAVFRSVCQQQYPHAVGTGADQLFLPDSLALMPLYMHGLMKSPILSAESAGAFLFQFDDKAALVHAVDIMTVAQTTALLYPNFIPVLPAKPIADPKRPIPDGAPASITSLKTDVGVLIDDGTNLMLWLGAAALQSFAPELLGPQAAAAANDPRQLAYQLLKRGEAKGSVASVKAIIGAVLSQRPAGTPLHVVPAGGPMQARAEALAVEGRTASTLGYKEFLTEVQRKVVSATPSRK